MSSIAIAQGPAESAVKTARRPTDEEILAGCAGDLDARPMVAGDTLDWQSFVHVGPLRRRLGLTQQEFADRFKINVACIRDWEQGRTRPDRTAVSYLRAIALEPEIIAEIVNRRPKLPDTDESA